MNAAPPVHRNSSISCDDDSHNEIWQITERNTNMRDFWKNLLTPWRQCGWEQQQQQSEETKASQTKGGIHKPYISSSSSSHPPKHDSPTTSSDDESSVLESSAAQAPSTFERPPLAKQRGSSIIHCVPPPTAPSRYANDMISCNSSTKSRHKREMALQEYPVYIDRIMDTIDHGELTEDEEVDDDVSTTEEDDDFFELSSSSNDELEWNEEEAEAWKYEWARGDSTTKSPSVMDDNEEPNREAPTYLPKTPIPHSANPNPVFVVGWAAVELVRNDHRQSLYFIQLIRDENLLAMELCNSTSVCHIIPYEGNLRTEYQKNTYKLNVANALKIIPVPIPKRPLSRESSGSAQHENILFLQFGLDAAARSCVR